MRCWTLKYEERNIRKHNEQISLHTSKRLLCGLTENVTLYTIFIRGNAHFCIAHKLFNYFMWLVVILIAPKVVPAPTDPYTSLSERFSDVISGDGVPEVILTTDDFEILWHIPLPILAL